MLRAPQIPHCCKGAFDTPKAATLLNEALKVQLELFAQRY